LIFFIPIISESFIQGAEIPAVVLFANSIDGTHNNKLFSRCISNLILVFKEDQAISMKLNSNMAHTIPVYGE